MGGVGMVQYIPSIISREYTYNTDVGKEDPTLAMIMVY